MAPENSQKLSPAEKQDARWKTWAAAPGIQFASPQVQQAYQERAQLFQDAVQLKKGKRVPIYLHNGFYPITYGGMTPEEAMKDFARLGEVLKKFNGDFMPDSLPSSLYAGSSRLLEILDFKLYRWPGHGVPSTAPYQFVENEYMNADEYAALIDDPSNFFIRSFLPRIFGAFSPWQTLPPFTDITELPFVGTTLAAFGNPAVQQSLEKLMEAGKAALEWVKACGAINNAIIGSLGLVTFTSGFSKAPYDIVADTLRGTRAVMLDKFRQPKNILAASERLTPTAIELGVRTSNNSGKPSVTLPLHKGADSFMSDADFKKFYWPSLKATILGMVNEGVVPFLFAEGSYNRRLDMIADSDIPAGTTVWMFDRTDLKEVKKKLGGRACFGGNVPVSMLATGTPQDVCDYVKRLIDNVAGDGGFILSTGAVVDEAKPENLHAMIDTAREYGVYH